MINLDSSNYNFLIENYKYNKYENVSSYNYEKCCPILNIEISNTFDISEKDYYYIFDCPGETAFVHWVFESFIFFKYFFKICELYPNIKILTKNNKKYVKNYFDFFNIKNTIVESITNFNNICFFSPVFSLNDKNINQSLYKSLIDEYILYVTINNNCQHILSNNKIIYLPRNTKDNYQNNDRIIENTNEINDFVINIGGSSLNTYDINNLNLQFKIINSFDIIIVDYGSSYFVNCIHLSDKKIIVLDNFYHSYQINEYVSMNILNEKIKTNNKVIFLRPETDKYVNIQQIKNLL